MCHLMGRKENRKDCSSCINEWPRICCAFISFLEQTKTLGEENKKTLWSVGKG